MNTELRQSMMVISAGKRMIVDAAAKNAPRVGGRLFQNGDIISAIPKGFNDSSRNFASDGWSDGLISMHSVKQLVRIASAPVGRGISFNGRNIYSSSPPVESLANLWFFAQATYAGVDTTAVNRPDPEGDEDSDLCNYPTWVNQGFLTSPVAIISQPAGTVPDGVFNPHSEEAEGAAWIREHTAYGIATFDTQPDECAPPDPLPEDWVHPEMMAQAPRSVTITSWLGSTYLRDVHDPKSWIASTEGLYWNGGAPFVPDPFNYGNRGFAPYVSVRLSRNGWSAAIGI